MRVGEIVDEGGDLKFTEVHAGARRGEVGRRQHIVRRVVLLGIRVLPRRWPLGPAFIFIVDANERFVIEEREFVLQANGGGIRRAGLRALAGNRIAALYDRRLLGRHQARVLGVAGVGVAGREFNRKSVGEGDFGLDVQALGNRGSEIRNERNLADRRHHGLLDVVPTDVVHAAGDLDAIVDIVLGSDLETVDRIGIERQWRAGNAETLEVRGAGGIGHGIVAAARTESLRVREVVEVPRIHLIGEAHLGRERILGLVRAHRRGRIEKLRASGQRSE